MTDIRRLRQGNVAHVIINPLDSRFDVTDVGRDTLAHALAHDALFGSDAPSAPPACDACGQEFATDAEQSDHPAVCPGSVTVVRVALDWCDGVDYIELSCGHALNIDADEDNASLVGAVTTCSRCTSR